MKRVRLHSYAHPTIVEWLEKYKSSRDRPKAHLGSQAMWLYFVTYLWGKSWVSIEEILSSPDYTKGNDYRSQFKIDAYMPKSYCMWLDTMDKRAIDFLDDQSPDRLKEIQERFGNRLYMVREHSLHLKRAIIILYKLSLIWPDILWIDLESVRPKGYEWVKPNFQDLDFLFAFTTEITQIIKVDLSKPPKISLIDY